DLQEGGAQLGEAGQLGAHHFSAPDDLVQRSLADDYGQFGAPLRQDQLLAGEQRLQDQVLRAGRQGRVSGGDRAGVLRGLEQVGYLLRLVGVDLGGGGLGDEVVQPGGGQDAGVGLPPAA